MSGIVRGIKKAFKKVVRVVKKIALPVLAIGAVVLTGGAALGVLPSVAGLASSLGLSSTLAGVLSSAATGATIGAAGAALTGGNIVRGATGGLIAGGATAGIGAALGAGGSAAASTGGQVAAAGQNAIPGASAAAAPASPAFSPSGAMGIGAQFRGPGIPTPASLGTGPLQSPQMPASLAPGAVAASGAPAAGRGGVMGFLERNPLMGGALIQGIGSGLSAAATARDAQRERRAIESSYEGVADNLYMPKTGEDDGSAAARFNAPIYGRVTYDRRTNRIVPVG
jgi:hypothetical protein